MSAFSLSFSALLRAGEITTSNSADLKKSSKKKTNKKRFKCLINNNINLLIRYSKTDKIGRSWICEIASVLRQSQICTLKAVKSYLKVSPYTEGSFCHLNCTCLTRYQFVSIIHGALKFLGYCTANTNTHSFRIAAATYLALKGESDETIKQKGRWSSN